MRTHVHFHVGRDAEGPKHDPKNGQFAAGGAGGKSRRDARKELLTRKMKETTGTEQEVYRKKLNSEFPGERHT